MSIGHVQVVESQSARAVASVVSAFLFLPCILSSSLAADLQVSDEGYLPIRRPSWLYFVFLSYLLKHSPNSSEHDRRLNPLAIYRGSDRTCAQVPANQASSPARLSHSISAYDLIQWNFGFLSPLVGIKVTGEYPPSSYLVSSPTGLGTMHIDIHNWRGRRNIELRGRRLASNF